MKTVTTLTFAAILLTISAFGQTAKVSVFARYANVATLQKEFGHFQANLVGLEVSHGRFGAIAALL